MQKLGHLPRLLLQGRVILIAAVSLQGHGLFETSLAEAEARGEMHGVMTKGIISPDIFMFILPFLLREICCSSLCGLINIPEESIKREQQPGRRECLMSPADNGSQGCFQQLGLKVPGDRCQNRPRELGSKWNHRPDLL